MALNGMDSNSVRFKKESPRTSQNVQKKHNFFDDDDDDDDFETFDGDKDFEKMTGSLTANAKTDDPAEDEEKMGGVAWGGVAYSLTKEDKSSVPVKTPEKVTVPAKATAPNKQKPSLNPGTQRQSGVVDPFHVRDQISKGTKFTSQVIQTSTVEKSATTTTTTTRYDEASTSSIENVVQRAKSEMTDAEKKRMQAEIKELQKTVSTLRKQHKSAPEPKETVKKLMLNQPCVLELYKSLDKKLSLLDEAIKLGDGDALITVILFIKKTVKYNLFVREISKRPVAIRHVISFMKAHYDYEELIKLLRLLNRKEEAMMLEYKKAVSLPNADSQIQAINACQRTYENAPELASVVSILSENQSLLKRQIRIEVKDKRSQGDLKDTTMRLHPRKSITSSPLIETLHYCCYYHYGKDDDTLGPDSLQKEFKLTDKQFEWTMIRARAELKKWEDLETLFTSKKWYGTNKLKSSLGFDKVVGILKESNAPPDILGKYLELIEDLETRLALATKMQCHKVAVETIVNMKDKQRLDDYRKNLERTHPVQALISRYLQNSQIKWK
ncbi:spermatogenesis-defective protein 39 homolog [Dendronephthya gigantea]|uniref:spermatogenesis-defective protein 39 homolog n=1 Tax=Dendronephthya gigantea TaxID=151771 RepID=UPI00106B46CC|nr:spermatogenesis-defective protein 39 homolog [Dendronephthya gigantea]